MPPRPTPDELKLKHSAQGLILGNPTKKRPWGVEPSLFWEVVPYYTNDDVQPAKLPNPPLIPEEVDDLGAAHFCAGWARSWYRREFGLEPTFGPQTQFRRYKSFKNFTHGIDTLRKERVSPVVWLTFFEKLWATNRTRMTAPIGAIFNQKTVWKHVQNAKVEVHLGGRMFMSPSLRKLAVKQNRMMTDLMQKRPRERAELEAVVSQHFAVGEHKLLKLKARKEAERASDGWNKAVETFQWIW